MAQPDPQPDYTLLPEPVRLEETRASSDGDPVPDPEAGRDPDHEWMLKHG